MEGYIKSSFLKFLDFILVNNVVRLCVLCFCCGGGVFVLKIDHNLWSLYFHGCRYIGKNSVNQF